MVVADVDRPRLPPPQEVSGAGECIREGRKVFGIECVVGGAEGDGACAGVEGFGAVMAADHAITT